MSATSKSKGVFINCPFDPGYRELFEAVVFAVLHCGFEPRSAQEASGSGRERFKRLMALIGDCELSIHDLSRVKLAPATKMPRFNMPLELGICIGAREFGNLRYKTKDFLILERLAGDCIASCSDLRGVDPLPHSNLPKRVIEHVRVWLNGHSNTPQAGPHAINRDYASFLLDLPATLESWRLKRNEVTFVDFRRAVKVWLAARPSGSTL